MLLFLYCYKHTVPSQYAMIFPLHEEHKKSYLSYNVFLPGLFKKKSSETAEALIKQLLLLLLLNSGRQSHRYLVLCYVTR
jgi:hypothetical protein